VGKNPTTIEMVVKTTILNPKDIFNKVKGSLPVINLLYKNVNMIDTKAINTNAIGI
jgi:hypothetical protein